MPSMMKGQAPATLKVFSCFLPFFVFCFTFHHKLIMRQLSLLTIAFLCLSTLLFGQKHQPDRNSPAQDVHSTPSAQQPPTQTTVVEINGGPQASNQEQVSKHARSESSWPEIISAWGTVTIAGLTLVYVFVNGLMLSQLKKDVAIAKSAADAAEITARAAVNAQRAWMRSGLEYGAVNGTYIISTRNDGKTPGRIVGYSLTPHRMDLTANSNPQPKEEQVIACNVWVNGGDSPGPINKNSITLFDLAQEVAPDPTGFPSKLQLMTIDLVVYYVPMIDPGTESSPNIRKIRVIYEWTSGQVGLKVKSTYYE